MNSTVRKRDLSLALAGRPLRSRMTNTITNTSAPKPRKPNWTALMTKSVSVLMVCG